MKSILVLMLIIGIVAAASIGGAYAIGLITIDANLLLNGDLFCTNCIHSPEIATDSVARDEIGNLFIYNARVDVFVTSTSFSGLTPVDCDPGDEPLGPGFQFPSSDWEIRTITPTSTGYQYNVRNLSPNDGTVIFWVSCLDRT